MSHFFQTGQHKSRMSFWRSLPVLFLLGALVLFIGWHAFRSYQNYRSVKARYDRLEERTQEMQAKNKSRADDLALIESKEGQERFIRERFDVKKEGEEVVIFIKGEHKPPEKPASVFHSFASFLKNLFGF